jgi:ribosomal protein S18 acetylase RimI-like enzyme
MSLTLRPMRADEFGAWLPRMRDDYADSLTRHGGIPADAARTKASADVENVFPGERPSPAQSVYVVESDGDRVGVLWVAERDDQPDLRGALWIFDIHIDEAHRGRGYGREAMLHAEAEARRRGLDRIALNVFGGNEVARSLYRSLGYVENAVVMSKSL